MLGAVLFLRLLGAVRLDAILARFRDVGLGRTADAHQAIQQALHGVRQRFIGLGLAGEQRVAAIGRDFFRQQHRSHRRLLQVGGVRMPDTAEVDFFVFKFLDFDDLRKLRQAFDKRIVDRFSHGPREGQKLHRRQRLPAQEDDAVVQQRLTHFGGGVGT